MLTYALEEGGPRRLAIEIEKGPCAVVRVDSAELGRLEGIRALRQGRSFQLPDESALFVGLASRGLLPVLRVERNGLPVPSAPLHPSRQVGISSAVLLFLGAVQIAIWSAYVAGVPLLQDRGIDSESLLSGGVLLVLGVASRRRSLLGVLAFSAAAALFAWGAFVVGRENHLGGQALLSGGVVFKMLFSLTMLRGAGAQGRQAGLVMATGGAALRAGPSSPQEMRPERGPVLERSDCWECSERILSKDDGAVCSLCSHPVHARCKVRHHRVLHAR